MVNILGRIASAPAPKSGECYIALFLRLFLKDFSEPAVHVKLSSQENYLETLQEILKKLDLEFLKLSQMA